MTLKRIGLLVFIFTTIIACEKSPKPDNSDITLIKDSILEKINGRITIGYAVATSPHVAKSEWESRKGDNGQPIVLVKSYPFKVENGKLGNDIDKSTYISFQFEIDHDKNIQVTSCGRYLADGTIAVAGNREDCLAQLYSLYFASHKKPEQQ